jgi:hypothetical protein
VLQLLASNQFPLISTTHSADEVTYGRRRGVQFRITTNNIGQATAFNFCCAIEIDGDDPNPEKPLALVPTQGNDRMLIFSLVAGPISGEMLLSYDSIIGVRVRELHEIKCFVSGGSLISGVMLKERTYHQCAPVEIEIRDDEI